MELDQFLKQVERISASKKTYSIKRIHIFYEGEVTEKEFIKWLIEKFKEHPEIFQLVDISFAYKACNCLSIVAEIISSKFYINEFGEKKDILDDDYVFYIYDFDVFFDFRKGSNVQNSKRVLKQQDQFLQHYEYLQREIKFILIPSFPSFEYFIALGLKNSLCDIACAKNARIGSVYGFFTKILGEKIPQSNKTFLKKFYNTDIFNLSYAIKNSIEDRRLKLLPQSISGLMSQIITAGSFNGYLLLNKPFSYVDNIFSTANTIISDI